MPPAPVLPGMLCELAAYGLMCGLLNKYINIENRLLKNSVVLIGAMLCGRVTYGVLNAFIFRAGNYSMQAWVSAAFVTAIPGSIIQLVLYLYWLIDFRKPILSKRKLSFLEGEF